MALGMLVQLRDDCFDLAPVQLTGDLAMGQFTLPVLYGLSQREHSLHEQLEELASRKHGLSHQESAELASILRKMGAYSFVVAMAKAYEQKALHALETFPESLVRPLQFYASYVFETFQGA